MGVSPGLLEVGLEGECRIPQEELLGRREALSLAVTENGEALQRNGERRRRQVSLQLTED